MHIINRDNTEMPITRIFIKETLLIADHDKTLDERKHWKSKMTSIYRPSQSYATSRKSEISDFFFLAPPCFEIKLFLFKKNKSTCMRKMIIRKELNDYKKILVTLLKAFLLILIENLVTIS